MEKNQKKNRPVAGWISVGLGILLAIVLIVDMAMGFDTEVSSYFAMGIFIVMLLGVGIPMLFKYIKSFGWAMGAIFCAGAGIYGLLFPEAQEEQIVVIGTCVLFELLAVLFAWLFIRANLKYKKENQEK